MKEARRLVSTFFSSSAGRMSTGTAAAVAGYAAMVEAPTHLGPKFKPAQEHHDTVYDALEAVHLGVTQEDTKIQKAGRAYIYVFEPEFEKSQVGHVAMGFVNPNNGTFEYLSVWPGIPVNPATMMFPLPIKLIPDVLSDIDSEGKKPIVLEISHLDLAQMADELDVLRRQSKNGSLSYQFINKFSLFNHIAGAAGSSTEILKMLLSDPFSESPCHDEGMPLLEERIQSPINCTSVIHDLLAHGGFPKKTFDGTPWTDSPSKTPDDLMHRGNGHVKELEGDRYDRAIRLATPRQKNESNFENEFTMVSLKV